MCVPGHDERDHEFATKFGLPIVTVISGGEKPVVEEAWSGDGTLVNSRFLDGLDVPKAISKMSEWLEENGRGKARVEYRLRDWLFSRQRYWGEPFPIVITDDGDIVAVDENDLPVELPSIDEYRPTDDGRPPLARAGEDWLRVTLPDGRTGTRETNTMPQWAGSCWYYLRFIDPNNDRAAWDIDLEKYWMPVDLYVGGVEHAVLHLLYVRFWHKVLFDCGLVSTEEPFPRLYNQGMVLATSYKDKRGKYVHPHEGKETDDGWVLTATGEPLDVQIEKMGKSKLNVVNPDDVVRDYGADSMRLYELFMGPLEIQKPWQMTGVEGVHRFLKRTWRLVVDDRSGELSDRLTDAPGTSEESLWRTLHKTVKKVTADTETLQMNTAIAQMMIFVNEATSSKTLPVESVKIFLQTLSAYAPHLCEELWKRLGEDDLLAFAPWPDYDEALCVEDTVLIAVQVNGKKKDEISVPRTASKDDLEKLALASEKAQAAMAGKEPRKVIAVPGRLVNIVV
ncbi:MAG: leucine--tRNA ligase, partial [Planctomycetota bacterium]